MTQAEQYLNMRKELSELRARVEATLNVTRYDGARHILIFPDGSGAKWGGGDLNNFVVIEVVRGDHV